MRTALVIGGGLAGASVAAYLAAADQPVTLVERETGAHHKVCGEFVSAEAIGYFHDLGLDLEALGAVPIEQVRISAGDRRASAPLPFPALALSRRVLDEALLQRAAALGARILRGRKAVGLKQDGGVWHAMLDDGNPISAREIFLATGKHDLRGWKRPPGAQNDLIGFKLHWRLSAAQTDDLRAAVELFLFQGGYAGLALIENDVANLCLVVRTGEFLATGQSWDTFFSRLLERCPHLQHRLAGAQPCWPRPLAISTIPYGFVQRHADGLWRLGDQAACIPSFSGDGMSIALHSAKLAAHHFLQGANAASFQSRLRRDVARQIQRATLISQILLQPQGQKAGVALAQHLPALLGVAARATRISARNVRDIGLSETRRGIGVDARRAALTRMTKKTISDS